MTCNVQLSNSATYILSALHNIIDSTIICVAESLFDSTKALINIFPAFNITGQVLDVALATIPPASEWLNGRECKNKPKKPYGGNKTSLISNLKFSKLQIILHIPT